MKKIAKITAYFVVLLACVACQSNYESPHRNYLAPRYERTSNGSYKEVNESLKSIKNSKLVDFTGFVLDIPYGKEIGYLQSSTSYSFPVFMDREIARTLYQNDSPIITSAFLESRGIDVYSYKDATFNSSSKRDPDIRIGAVVKNLYFYSEQKITTVYFIPVVVDCQVNVYYSIEWQVYDVKNDNTLLKITDTGNYAYIRDKFFNSAAFLPGRYSNGYELQDILSRAIVESSIELFSNDEIVAIFDRDVDSPFAYFKSSYEAQLAASSDLWDLFADIAKVKKSPYYKVMKKLIKEIEAGVEETKFSDEKLVAENKVHKGVIYGDGKKLDSVLVSSGSVFMIIGQGSAEKYQIEYENGIVIDGALDYFDDSLNIAYVSFPILSEFNAKFGGWNSKYNANGRIMNKDFSEIRVSGKLKSYKVDSVRLLKFSEEDNILDQSHLGSLVFDDFGNVVGVVTLYAAEDEEPQVVILNVHMLAKKKFGAKK
ncbi:MAG: hypothetical protein JXR63_05345 [Spirochaetales bacterium]|nr:hypothetical protein [Spirochaetales bacterium]